MHARTHIRAIDVRRRNVDVSALPRPAGGPPRDQSELARLEALHRIHDLFIWLSWRFQPAFQGRDIAVQQQALCARLIDEGLHNLAAHRTSRQESAALKMRQMHSAWWTHAPLKDLHPPDSGQAPALDEDVAGENLQMMMVATA